MPNPKKNVAYTFHIALGDQAARPQFKAAPTLAAGDFKVSTDGSALANPATLPVVDPAASKSVKVALSAAEMNGDRIVFICSDAAGAEWDDVFIYIETTTVTIDDLATSAALATVQADTDNIQTRLPATLIGARMDASVGAVATDAIGAAGFSQAAADKVWSSATRTLTAFSTALALSVWDVLESAILTASSIGLKVKNNVDAAITSRATPAQVNTEVLDVLTVDTFAESGQQAPPATATLSVKLGYVYKSWRNRHTQTATVYSLYNDDATTVAQKATVSDDTVTTDVGEVATGP